VGDDRWPPPVGGSQRFGGVPLRPGGLAGWAWLSGPGRIGTPRPFLFFFDFSLFFSFLFENFGFLICFDLNDFKSAKFVK
jgi:hypothetical protein